jgi:glutamine synthetase
MTPRQEGRSQEYEGFVKLAREARPGARASAQQVLALVEQLNVRYLQLQFTDILGINKNVEVPQSQFGKALEGQIMFDGSSIEGFVRIEESDMLLVPDLATFRVDPRTSDEGGVARLICDIANTDGTPFAGCPRSALKRQLERARAAGFAMMAGCEAEFFLFLKDGSGQPTTATHDVAGYFDVGPVDRGEAARRTIVADLQAMGFEVEAAHHEVAPGQHEVDFRYADALTTADDLTTFRLVVRGAAERHDLVATFMPKPIFGQNGSGMHTHQSLFKGGKNAFFDPKGQWELSGTALGYIAGLIAHARGFCAVTNPLVNSFKRLVPGYEAPVNVAWSMKNRSPMIRIPDRRGTGTRVELRLPDPSANPYLALAVQLAAGLDGMERGLEPPEPVNKNIFELTYREKRHHRIDDLPRDLHEALDELEKDQVILGALGEHIAARYLEAKRAEWHEYITQVSEWEVHRYLGTY